MKNQKGQALLLVLLALAVTLTVVLSAVSRSTTDISISTQEEDSLRAFSAAEAGIEESLSSGSSVGITSLSNDAEFETTVVEAQSGNSFNYPADRLSGESGTFWFVSHDVDGDLTCSSLPCLAANTLEFCWGDPSTPVDNTSPAVEVSIFYDTSGQVVSSGNFSSVEVAREAFDGVAARASLNNFSSASSGCTVGSENYQFSSGSISLPALGIPCSGTTGCLLMARARLIYNENTPHPVAINANAVGGSLPAQGIQIDSTGTAGDSTRRVNVFQSYAEFPEVFEAGVFGVQNLVKN